MLQNFRFRGEREREKERAHKKRENDRLIDEKKEPEVDSQLCLFPPVVLGSFFM